MKFDIIKQKSTLSPFSTIIYFFDGTDQILVEKPKIGKCITIRDHQLSNYISLKTIDVNWRALANDQYIKLTNHQTYHVFPLFNEDYRFVNFTFNFRKETPLGMFHPETNEIYQYQNFEVENFKLVSTNMSRNDVPENERTYYPTITCRLPLFKLYTKFKIQTDSNNVSSIVNSNKLFMKIDSNFYRFPYGNVDSTDNMCFGDVYRNAKFKNSTETQLIKLMSSTFNDDYQFHLKQSTLLSSVKTTLDLNYISKKIKTNEFVSVIDMLYYLSQISIDECYELIDNDKIFYQTPDIDSTLRNLILNSDYA